MKSDTAASDLIGVMALIAIFVTATAIAGVALLSYPPGEAAPAMIARNVTAEGESLSLSHDGGDPLVRGHFKILVDGVDQTERFSLNGTFDWVSWETGQILVFSDDLSEDAHIQIVGEGVGLTGSEWLLHEIGTAKPTTEPTAVPTTVPTTPAPVPLVASFTANVTNGTTPLAVQFNDTSTGEPTSWSWTFGDGSTADKQNPTHTYTAPGTYTVTLTVTRAGASDTETKTGYITVYDGCSSPGLLGTYYPTMDFKGTPVQRIDQRLWFADAEAGSTYHYYDSDEENWPSSTLGKTDQFSVVYEGYLLVPTDATYTFYLTSDDGSCLWIDAVDEGADPLIDNWGYHSPREMNSSIHLSAESHPIKVEMFEGNGAAILYLEWSSPAFERKPVDSFCQGTVQVSADFTATPLDGTAPLEVQFTDASTGGPTSWSWDFGDGGTSTLQNPSHIYTAAGTYTVSLTATNTAGNNVETKTGYITVTVPPLAADFSASPRSGTTPLTIQFTDESTGNPTSWLWDFGDSGTSTLQNPSHTYASAGIYTVTLTATNAGGSDPETKTDYITVASTSGVHTIKLYSPKASYFESGGYYQFEMSETGGGSLNIAGTSVSLHPGEVVRLTLGSDTTGTLNVWSTGIGEFPSSNITVTINGVVVGSGTLSGINVHNTNFTESTLTVNVPAVMGATTFTVDGNTIISGQDERQIRLYNIQPTSEGKIWLDTSSNVVNIDTAGAKSYQLITPPQHTSTLHVSAKKLNGDPLDIDIEYWGDMSGSGPAPFDIFRTQGNSAFTITIQAASGYHDDGGPWKTFKHWVFDGVNQGDGQPDRVISVGDSSERTAVAIYN
jgi:PKD repeat protein